jgi:hypothetical protein
VNKKENRGQRTEDRGQERSEDPLDGTEESANGQRPFVRVQRTGNVR